MEKLDEIAEELDKRLEALEQKYARMRESLDVILKGLEKEDT